MGLEFRHSSVPERWVDGEAEDRRPPQQAHRVMGLNSMVKAWLYTLASIFFWS